MAGKRDVCVRPKKDSKSLERRAAWYQHMLSARKTFQNGIQPLNVFQFHFSSCSQLKELIFLRRQGTGHHAGVHSGTARYCCRSLAITTSRALAAKLKHLAPGHLPSSQKFIISDRKHARFPWIWFRAARYRCGCTCCNGREQDSNQTTRTRK